MYRAAGRKLVTPGLGNLMQQPVAAGGPVAATSPVTWVSPGNPMALDADIQAFGEKAYLGNTYVMRCVQAIAQTIGGLEFRAGIDPRQPANYDPTAPLVQLLGPGTPQAPGGPNPETSSLAFWVWSICQYVIYGRFAWEAQLTGGKNGQIVALWPLVAPCIAPVSTMGGPTYFDKYIYTTPQKGDQEMTPEKVVYCWRQSLMDPRQPESPLSAAKLPTYIAMGMDKYFTKMLQNNMVGTTLVVTPPFDDAGEERAWQEQFLTSFTGVDNTGKTIFATAEADETDTSGKPLVQVERLAQTAVEGSLIQLSKEAKIDITVALGVPLSLIGNASQRTYSNADSEYRNFWTITALPYIKELQEHINLRLAGRIGEEVGWFDLSKVEALKPPSIFAPPMIGDVINSGVATPEQVANVLQIPAADWTGDADSDTVAIDQESSQTGAGGTRTQRHHTASMGLSRGKVIWEAGHVRDTADTGPIEVSKRELIAAYLRYQQRPLNTHNYDDPFRAAEWIKRERIVVRSPKDAVIDVEAIDTTTVTKPFTDRVERVLEARTRPLPALPAPDVADHLSRLRAATTTVYDRPKVPRAPVLGLTDRDHDDKTCFMCDNPATRLVDPIDHDKDAVPCCTHHVTDALVKAGLPTDSEATPEEAQAKQPITLVEAIPIRGVYETGDDLDAWLDENESALEAASDGAS
jgi:HK97 family phage portal protein